MKYQLTQYKTDGTAHRWTQGNKPVDNEIAKLQDSLKDGGKSE